MRKSSGDRLPQERHEKRIGRTEFQGIDDISSSHAPHPRKNFPGKRQIISIECRFPNLKRMAVKNSKRILKNELKRRSRSFRDVQKNHHIRLANDFYVIVSDGRMSVVSGTQVS